MANEDKKDFNAMLHKETDMPKIQIITAKKVIKKHGGESNPKYPGGIQTQ